MSGDFWLGLMEPTHMLIYFAYYMAHMAGASVRVPAVRQLLP